MKTEHTLQNLSDFDNKSLLIVDDDNPFRERLSRAMEKKGFEVVQAESVKQGVNAVKTKKYLNQDISEKIKESNEQRKIENIFAKGANGESQFIQLFQEVQDLLDQNISQSSQNILLRHLLLIVQYYVSYSLDVNFNLL